MPRLKLTSLTTALLIALTACGTPTPSAPHSSTTPDNATLRTQTSPQPAPSRLRDSQGHSKVASFSTYYLAPDGVTLQRLARRDLSVVQPDITPEQMRTLQTTGYAVVYLSVGELGTTNTYYLNGVPTSGTAIYNAHVNDGWFVGKNGNFGAYLLDLRKPEVRQFVLDQADYLLDREFDGLFLDTVDDAEIFKFADAYTGSGDYVSGQITVYNSPQKPKPSYAAMRAAYVQTVKALRGVAGKALLVQNGGFDVLLDRFNGGAPNAGTQNYVDAVMHEVAVTKGNPPQNVPDTVWPKDPANYESWEDYFQRLLREGKAADEARDRAYRAERNQAAEEYFQAGGVVLQQDFGLSGNIRLQCASWKNGQAVRDRYSKDGWLSAIADASFNQLVEYTDKNDPAVRAEPACAGYNYRVQPDFALSFTPPVLGTVPGRNASTTFKVDAISNYSGSVTLGVGNLPSGIVVSLSQGSVQAGAATPVSVNAVVAASAQPGTYTLPIRASSQGHTMVYDLRLTVYPDRGESVFVSHAGIGNILAYDGSAGLQSSSLASRQTGKYTQIQPSGVAVDRQGRTVVAENPFIDPATGKSILLAPDGSEILGRLKVFSPFGLYPGGETATLSNVRHPTDVWFDGQDRLWVVENGYEDRCASAGCAARISRYDTFPTANSLPSFSIDFAPYRGSYGYPKKVALTAAGDIWVATAWGWLVRFDANGVKTGAYANAAIFGEINALRVSGNDLWVGGAKYAAPAIPGATTVAERSQVTSAVVRLNLNTLNGLSGDFSTAITKTITSGLYIPTGVDVDSAGNLWLTNSTGPEGAEDHFLTEEESFDRWNALHPDRPRALDNGRKWKSKDPGSLLRFPAASLNAASPAPDLNINLGARYPTGVAVKRP